MEFGPALNRQERGRAEADPILFRPDWRTFRVADDDGRLAREKGEGGGLRIVFPSW